MGNQTINGEGYSEFPIERYLNRGLSRQEVIGVRKIFDRLEPEQEKVKVEKMREAFAHSFQRQYLENKVGKKQQLTYDEFFVIFSQNMNQKKRLYKDNVTFQSDGQVVECLFCPYAVDMKRD